MIQSVQPLAKVQFDSVAGPVNDPDDLQPSGFVCVCEDQLNTWIASVIQVKVIGLFMLMVQTHLTMLAGVGSGSKAFSCQKKTYNSKFLELIMAWSRECCFEAEAAKHYHESLDGTVCMELHCMQHDAWYACFEIMAWASMIPECC